MTSEKGNPRCIYRLPILITRRRFDSVFPRRRTTRPLPTTRRCPRRHGRRRVGALRPDRVTSRLLAPYVPSLLTGSLNPHYSRRLLLQPLIRRCDKPDGGRARRSVGQHTVSSMPPSLAAPCARLAWRLGGFVTNPHE